MEVPDGSEIIEEAEGILEEIYPGSGIRIGTKKGGWTAVYSPTSRRIILRENSWRRMDLFSKRLLLIHETLHDRGVRHGIQNLYLGHLDLLSLTLYRRIYGEDEPYQKAMERIEGVLSSLPLRGAGRRSSGGDGDSSSSSSSSLPPVSRRSLRSAALPITRPGRPTRPSPRRGGSSTPRRRMGTSTSGPWKRTAPEKNL